MISAGMESILKSIREDMLIAQSFLMLRIDFAFLTNAKDRAQCSKYLHDYLNELQPLIEKRLDL